MRGIPVDLLHLSGLEVLLCQIVDVLLVIELLLLALTELALVEKVLLIADVVPELFLFKGGGDHGMRIHTPGQEGKRSSAEKVVAVYETRSTARVQSAHAIEQAENAAGAKVQQARKSRSCG